jgi:hypothetical protein
MKICFLIKDSFIMFSRQLSTLGDRYVVHKFTILWLIFIHFGYVQSIIIESDKEVGTWNGIIEVL